MTIYISIFTAILFIIALVLQKKHRPLKIRTLLILQLIILFVVFIYGSQLYEYNYTIIEASLYNNQDEACDIIKDGLKNSDNVEEVILSSLQQFTDTDSDTYHYKSSISYALDNFYFNLQILDKYKNVVIETPDKCNLIFFKDTTTKKTKMIDLNKFFSEEEIEEALPSIGTSKASYSTVSISGYYDQDDFIVEEAEFTDFESKENYILGEIKNQKTVTLYDDNYSKYFNIKNKNKSVSVEKGNLYTYLLNTSDDTSEAFDELSLSDQITIDLTLVDLKNESADFKTSNNVYVSLQGYKKLESDYSYILYSNINFDGIAADDTSYKDRIIEIGCVMESVALLLVIFYTFYIKKKRELDETRNTFINAMAHEMKTPAAVILNSTEVIRENIHPEKNEHYLDMISDESIHLNNLLQQMLTYTRTNETKELEKETAEVKTLVNHVLKHYDFSNYELITDIQDSTIECNPSLIEMVMDNFISNALRYSNHTIRITYKDGTFSVYNSEEAISKETIKHLWEPLYKGDDARNDTSTSGMGLAISANILKLHKFKYGVTQDDTGITFYFKK